MVRTCVAHDPAHKKLGVLRATCAHFLHMAEKVRAQMYKVRARVSKVCASGVKSVHNIYSRWYKMFKKIFDT